jgi:sortase A
MNDDKPKPLGHFDASLPLPTGDSASSSSDSSPSDVNPAADLIRQRVSAAYKDEPDAATESQDISSLGDELRRSKHQQFIYELTNSGKPLHEIQTAWHEYYAALHDSEKHEVWQEFYAAHAQASNQTQPSVSLAAASGKPAKHRPKPQPVLPGPLADLAKNIAGNLPGRKALEARPHLQSLAVGIGVGAIAIVIFSFSFFNERIIAPFIQPSRQVTNTPIISDTAAIDTEPEVIIPKINVEVPVVYGLPTAEDKVVEKALEDGVVHYAGTAAPGQDGNSVIVGHSSNNLLNRGKYKFAFVLLNRLEAGDTFYLQRDGKRYTYQVYQKKIVKPTDVSVLGNTDKKAVATLITCDPPGTSTNRLVVVGEQINPNPIANTPGPNQQETVSRASSVPGDAPTLWARIARLLAR